MIAAVVAYALSPIHLSPDFIPIFGYLDDLVLLPIGIWLAIRMYRRKFCKIVGSVRRRLIFNCRAIGGRPASFFSWWLTLILILYFVIVNAAIDSPSDARLGY